ncbi:mechanosensitive ion channel family protein [Mesonia sp. HuA40]|uniref:mechanosensitive ion channel family protein n=1 Tax=Mesonia sp. HuA40 TaxID=2602761 RepID=UPI0011C773AF|nr:mechanosensitive ion channel family protein [Mesonia sp. HuA40]TXK70224.1 mechanosensitive ion channel family protein [Mesonia sp. HuA40]
MKNNFYLSIISVLLYSIFSFAQSNEKNEDTIYSMPEAKSVVDTAKSKFLANPISEYNEAYFILDRLNTSIGLPPNQINLETPQAALEHFLTKAEAGKYQEAAYTLNLNLLPKTTTIEEAAVLAEKFHFVLKQRVKIDWDNLADRPDGQLDFSTTTNKAVAGKPRRSVAFGAVKLNNRNIVLRVQRIKYKNYGAFWLVSSNTVENIEPLYAEYGPRKLDRMMPNWARVQLWDTPIWKPIGTLCIFFISYFLGRLLIFIIRKGLIKSNKIWVQSIAKKLSKPAGITMGILFFYILLNELISFTGRYANTLYTVLLIIVIGAITWLIMKLIDYIMVHIAENRIGDTNPEENSEARMMLTYISVARRVITFVVIIVGVAVIISQFRTLERLGISLIASAGVATVIIGVAAQSTLGNIIAGIQIAITKPARIGDTVIIKDDWGYVEDIQFTYMVVRTWDLRRLVVPLKYVVSNVFENWSMTNAHQIRPIIIHADYTVNVNKIRAKFKELVEADEDWDGEHPPKVQVVEANEKTIEIRALCSAKDASHTWDFHCRLREKLITYLVNLDAGAHLPTSRYQNTQQ